MRAVKSKGGKQDLGLTVTKATSQARAIVNKVMPGAGATVESRSSWDLDADRAIIITTITFPRSADFAAYIASALLKLSGAMTVADSSIVITRTVR